MNALNKIDTYISKQMLFLEQETNNMRFQRICEITLTENIDGIPWDNLSHSGIYLFEIKVDLNKFKSCTDWKDDFTNKWRDEKYHEKHTPNLKEKRLSEHKKLKKWMPIYLGKSKNISSRVKQHLYLEFKKTTFALKLIHRKNLANSVIKISTIKIDVNNYDVIVPKIESQLRNKINPLAGKQ